MDKELSSSLLLKEEEEKAIKIFVSKKKQMAIHSAVTILDPKFNGVHFSREQLEGSEFINNLATLKNGDDTVEIMSGFGTSSV